MRGHEIHGASCGSDALSVGNFANPGEVKVDENTGEKIYPGVVIVVGDDPWSQSTSTPADSRYLFKHLHMSFLEPSNPKELKDWMKVALKISKKSSVYQGVLLNTFIAEGGGRVTLEKTKIIDKELVTLDTDSFDLQKNVMVPPNSLVGDKNMINERFPLVEKALEEMALDQIFGKLDAKVGIVSAGVIFESLKEVLETNELLNDIKLLKVASSFPLVKNSINSFCDNLDYLIVVEEKRDFLENEIKATLSSSPIKNNLKIYGKKFPDNEEGFPAFGGLNNEIIQNKLSSLFSKIDSDISIPSFKEGTFKNLSHLPGRLPTFCPGCPHRETLSLLKEIRKDLKKKEY